MLSWMKRSAAVVLAGMAALAQAQALDGPLRVVVGYAPGGASDRVARIVAEKLQGRLGVPVLVATGWNAFFAPASMPRDKLERLARAIREVMQEPDTARKFADAKMPAVVSTPAQTEAMIRAFRAQWAPVVQQSGYQP